MRPCFFFEGPRNISTTVASPRLCQLAPFGPWSVSLLRSNFFVVPPPRRLLVARTVLYIHCPAVHALIHHNITPAEMMDVEGSGVDNHNELGLTITTGEELALEARQDEQTRSWEAEWSGDVALGITGSSMRRGQTSRRGAQKQSGAGMSLGITGSSMRQGQTNRRGAQKQSGAGMSRSASPARR